MKNWIIGNWKSNPLSLNDAIELSITLKKKIVENKRDVISNNNSQQLMVMPSTLHLATVQSIFTDTDVLLGAQDVSRKSAKTGAYTGDSCAEQLTNIGVRWTLVGHSERREYYQENDIDLMQKVDNAFSENLGVVFCIGESLTDYENQQTISVLTQQLSALKTVQLLTENIDKIIIAYEPIWAIGTGKVPTVDEVETVHKAIHQVLIEIHATLADVAIIYGGSVNPDNAPQFAQSKWIQGALIGGAALDADKFLSIADAFYQADNK